MVLRTLDSHMWKMQYTKINSKWNKALNIWLETLKLLGEKKKTKEKPSHNWSWQYSFGYDPKSIGKKMKHRQVGYIKIKSFCTAKEANKQNEWKNYCKIDNW